MLRKMIDLVFPFQHIYIFYCLIYLNDRVQVLFIFSVYYKILNNLYHLDDMIFTVLYLFFHTLYLFLKWYGV